MKTETFRSRLLVLLGVAGFLLLPACSSDPKNDAEEERFHMETQKEQAGYVEFVGNVTYVPFDGGFYGLTSGAENYDPLQLPKEFQQDGMKVRVRARERDWVSGRNWGRMVHVVRIAPCCDEEDEDD